MPTPYDTFRAEVLNKQAVDALVPGAVGAGANPGTTGSLDSDPAGATNSQITAQRAAQGAAPIMANTDADGGAGYSHPAVGQMPGMQMFADVKAATVIESAIGHATDVYLATKKAAFPDCLPDQPAPAPASKQASMEPKTAYEAGREYALRKAAGQSA
jgi:hypothetical protein